MSPERKNVALPDYSGRRVTVMGLGRFGGGVGVSRFLAKCGADVTVTDLADETVLAESLAQLADVPIRRFALNGHPPDVFRDCDLLVINPAVKPNQADVLAAVARGVEVTSEIEIFCRHNPAPVIAVTGSNGKSTTTALIHHLLQHCWQDDDSRVWLGGNIGISLLDQLQQIRPEDLVVLEISSFQLEQLKQGYFRPQIAVITNFSPNHLDWHGSVDAYRAAKQRILDAQTRTDYAVLPADDDAELPWNSRGGALRFGIRDTGEDGAFVEDGSLILRSGQSQSRGGSGCVEDAVRLAQPAQLPGEHNRKNIAAAACVAWLAGAEADRFSEALLSFVPLPHRFQLVAARHGRKFYNDSIATTPESAIQALRVFAGRVILLAGGYDKGQDLTAFAAEIRQRATVAVLMGQTAETLRRLIANAAGPTGPEIMIGADFSESFLMAVALSHPGDIVLLSPGCASFGWFRDYRDRGEQFQTMAKEWTPDT